MQKIGGNVYCNDSANIIYSSSDIVESNEPWNQDVRSAPFVIKDYLIIREQLSISSLEKINSKKILIGMNTFFNSNDFPNPNKPKLNVINNGEQWQINGVQKVLHVDSVTNAQLELLNNIYNVNVFKGNNNVFGTSSRYAYRSYINNASNVVFCVINSLPSISSNNNGINEFDVQSITVESTTGKLDNGKDPLYINHSIQLKANLIDVEKAYNKDVIWSSSNTSIATVDETGKVTGVNLGQVVITATSSYHSEVFGTYNTEVIPDDSLVGVTSVWITSSTNKSSKTVVGTSSEHDGVSGITVAQNWSYHEEVTSTDTTITYSLKWEPSNGQISQVQWTFYSPTGEREYMVDYSGTKVANKTTIDDDGSRSTKIHFDGRTNQKPDACVLRCKVTDINNTEYSCDFNIMHNSGVCVTGNTLVTMADGSYKAIKDVKLGELVKTWSFKEGAFVNRPIIWYESGTMQNADVITVVFDDGSKVEAIWKQSFFDAELLDYVTIDSSNYSSFIGKKLLSDIGTSTIGYKRVVDAYVENKDTEYYEIDTMYDYQYLANNILTVEPTLHEHVWFEVTPEFKYDPIKMEQDLEKYGPLDYNLVKDLVTYDQYLWWGGEYLAVPIGKGYFTLDYLIEVIKQFINDNYEVA
ncbi:MAG: Ig-like domain-containing protein [Bacilli bacterium]|nr:Ig-like domain-containing protein [Bacilli bacterium]